MTQTGGTHTGGAGPTGGALPSLLCRDGGDDALCGPGMLCIGETCAEVDCHEGVDCVSGQCDMDNHT